MFMHKFMMSFVSVRMVDLEEGMSGGAFNVSHHYGHIVSVSLAYSSLIGQFSLSRSSSHSSVRAGQASFLQFFSFPHPPISPCVSITFQEVVVIE